MPVRDYSKMPAVVKAVESTRDMIIACWSDWDAEAGQDAQVEQSTEAWLHTMSVHLECVLYGMLDQIPDEA